MLCHLLTGSCAVVFSHPMDLTKTRLQLDNELAKRGSPRSYKGILDCLQHNFNNYGIRGLQRGLQFGETLTVNSVESVRLW